MFVRTGGLRNERATKISCRAGQENSQTSWKMENGQKGRVEGKKKAENWLFSGPNWSGKV